MHSKEQIILNYITAYNKFDVDTMLKDFDENIVFENISNGEANMRLEGIEAFRQQAEAAKNYFSQRKQTVTSFEHRDNETEVQINYYAVLAVDLPNGLKKGDELHLKGKSIFRFNDDKIISLTDIS